MLDSFEILTTSGVVLFSKHYVPVSSNIVNALINDVFIEEKVPSGTKTGDDNRASRNPPYRKEKYTLKWTTAKDLGLIFVAAYQSILHLNWVDNLLDVVRGLFIKEFGKELRKPGRTDCSGFGPTFDALVTKLDKTSSEQSAAVSESESVSAVELTPPSSTNEENGFDEPPPPPVPGLKKPTRQVAIQDASVEATPIATPDTSRPASPAISQSQLLTAKAGPGGKGSRRARKLASASGPVSSADESSRERRPANARKVSGKVRRKWDAEGFATEEDDTQLDYSQQDVDGGEEDMSQMEDVKAADMGNRTGKGEFVLKDLDDEVNAILAESRAKDVQTQEDKGLMGRGFGAFSGYFKNIVGGKTLTKEDLVTPLINLEDHLLKKNVAREAAVRLCESVERDLIGTKTGNFTSMYNSISNNDQANTLRHRKHNARVNDQSTNPHAHTNNLPRPPSRHNLNHQLTQQSTALCHLHRRRERRRQIHQPVQTSLLSAPEQLPRPDLRRRHLPLWRRRATTRARPQPIGAIAPRERRHRGDFRKRLRQRRGGDRARRRDARDRRGGALGQERRDALRRRAHRHRGPATQRHATHELFDEIRTAR